MAATTLSKIKVPKGKHVVRIFDGSGHRDVVYAPDIEQEVATAMEAFDESMAKGMRAFKLDEAGGGGEVIHTFDKTAPQTVIQPHYVGG